MNGELNQIRNGDQHKNSNANDDSCVSYLTNKWAGSCCGVIMLEMIMALEEMTGA